MSSHDHDTKDFRHPKNQNVMLTLSNATHQLDYPYMYSPKYMQALRSTLTQYLSTCWDTTYNVPVIDPPVAMDTPRDYLI